MLLFLLIVLPWHIIMFKIHNPLFFNEYIIKHHLHRFLNTANNEIGRKQPFYYYFMIILWGFIPWIFSMIAVFVDKVVNWKKQNYIEKIKTFNFDSLDNVHKMLALLLGFGFVDNNFLYIFNNKTCYVYSACILSAGFNNCISLERLR